MNATLKPQSPTHAVAFAVFIHGSVVFVHLICLFGAFANVKIAPQGPAMQPVFSRGLRSLSVPEVGELLDHLGLHTLVPTFKNNDVSDV